MKQSLVKPLVPMAVLLVVLAVFVVSAQGEALGSWASTTAYPIAPENHSCVVSGGYVYCVGGETDVGPPFTAAAYFAPLSSSGAGAWKSTTSYPNTISRLSCVASGGYIYCVGGFSSSFTCCSNAVWFASLSSSGIGIWFPTNNYPTTIESQSCVESGGYIYCVGGSPGNNVGDQISAVYFASLSSSGVGTWTSTNSYPTNIAGESCVASGGYVYCVGGFTGTPPYATAVYFASLSSSGVGTWTSTNAYPIQILLDAQPCVALGGYIYCVGGYDGSTGFDISNVYFASLSSSGVGTWTSTTSYPTVIEKQSCVASGGLIYCVAGFAGFSGPSTPGADTSAVYFTGPPYSVKITTSGLPPSASFDVISTVTPQSCSPGCTGQAGGTTVTVTFNAVDTPTISTTATVDAGQPTQYVRTTSPASISISNAGQTFTFSYQTQYLQTFAASGLAGDATGTVVTVNSVPVSVGSLTYTLYLASGTVTYSYNDPVSSTTTGKQYRLASVTGPSSGYTVTAPNTVTGNYVAQFFLTVKVSPSATYGSTSLSSGFYDVGSPVSITATPNVGYAFNDWTTSGVSCSGGATSNPCTFNMPSHVATVTANFQPLLVVTLLSPASGSRITQGGLVNVVLKLQVTSLGKPVQGATVSFVVDGKVRCTTTTSSNGMASCGLKVAISMGSEFAHQWYATASKPGYGTAKSVTWIFIS